MTAQENLNQAQFMDVRDVGKLEAGDYPGYTMAQYARSPGKAARDSGISDKYEPRDYRELTDAIRAHGGVHTPLKIGDGDSGLAVWDGHHRYVAAKRAGVKTVPVERIA